MILRPPSSTRTDTPFPYTTLFRSASDPHIIQVMAGLGAEYDVVLVAGSDGRLAADVRPLVRLSLTVIAERNGRREMGHAGGGGRLGLAYFSEDILQGYVERSEEHTSELQSLMRISYAGFCLKKKNKDRK